MKNIVVTLANSRANVWLDVNDSIVEAQQISQSAACSVKMNLSIRMKSNRNASRLENPGACGHSDNVLLTGPPPDIPRTCVLRVAVWFGLKDMDM